MNNGTGPQVNNKRNAIKEVIVSKGEEGGVLACSRPEYIKKTKLDSYHSKKKEIIKTRFFTPKPNISKSDDVAGGNYRLPYENKHTEANKKAPTKQAKDLSRLIEKVKRDNARGYDEDPNFQPKIDANALSIMERRLYAMRSQTVDNKHELKCRMISKKYRLVKMYEIKKTTKNMAKIIGEWNLIVRLIKSKEHKLDIKRTNGSYNLEDLVELKVKLDDALFQKAVANQSSITLPKTRSLIKQGNTETGEDVDEEEEDEVENVVKRLLGLKKAYEKYRNDLHYTIFYPNDKTYISVCPRSEAKVSIDLGEDEKLLKEYGFTSDESDDENSNDTASTANSKGKASGTKNGDLNWAKNQNMQKKIYLDISQNIEYYKITHNNLSKSEKLPPLSYNNLLHVKEILRQRSVNALENKNRSSIKLSCSGQANGGNRVEDNHNKVLENGEVDDFFL